MNRSALAAALALVGMRDRALLAAIVAAQVIERAVLVAAALFAVQSSAAAAGIATAALAALFAVRAPIRAALSRRVRSSLVDAVVRGVFAGDVLAADALDEQGLMSIASEGLLYGPNLVSDHVPSLLGDGIAAMAIAVFAATHVAPQLVMIAAAACTLAAAAMLLGRVVTSRLSSQMYAAYEPIYDDLMTAIQGRVEIVTSAREEGFLRRVHDDLAAWRRAAAHRDLLGAFAGRGPALAAAIVVGAAVLVDRSLRGAVFGTALADAALVTCAVPPFLGVSRATLECAKALASIRSLVALIALRPHAEEARERPPVLPARIEWRRVSFAYADRAGNTGPLALRDVTIEWPAGRVLVLQGPNGSGKSTLLRLLLRLAAPAQGEILVGGMDLSALDPREWRRHVAYLPQRPYLPHAATARDAVRLLVPDASDDAIRAQLARVGLGRSPSGADPIDRTIGAMSAGERQRLGLARTLCSRAPIVLLDEPDANLDRAGIELVARIVSELSRDRMVALGAHSPELMALADVTVVLQAGRAVVRTTGDAAPKAAQS